MPLRDFKCNACEAEFETYVTASEDTSLQTCPKCSKMDSSVLPALVGNYRISGDNSSSTRPRRGGAFKRGTNGK